MDTLPRQLHLIGVAGKGMGSLAGILLENGFQISGCDLSLNEDKIAADKNLKNLQQNEVLLYPSHNRFHLSSQVGVIYSSAIPLDNLEIVEAKKHGIPLFKRSEALGLLMRDKYGVAIAGSAGKTTTTAMVTHLLKSTEVTSMIGDSCDNLEAGYCVGKGPYFVAEADEYDRSFLDLNFQCGVLTHYFWGDHLDYYHSEQEMRNAFVGFVNAIPENGCLVVNFDVEALRNISNHARCSVISYGFENGNYKINKLANSGRESAASICEPSGKTVSVKLPLLGKHNFSNALAAALVAKQLEGQTMGESFASLNTFRGVTRRLEFLGNKNGCHVYDDFAHNRIQIVATLNALRQKHPQNKLWVVFKPHQYRRTRVLLGELASSFGAANEIIVTDVSKGLGDTQEQIQSIHANDVVKAINHHNNNQKARYLPTVDGIDAFLLAETQPGDVVVTLGTRNIREGLAEGAIL